MIYQESVRTPTGPRTRVTFELPRGIWAESVHLVGDFNGWNAQSHPFQRDREGQWSLAVDLAGPGPFQFRYLVDGECWLTDGQGEAGADAGALSAFVVRPMTSGASAEAAVPVRGGAARALRTRHTRRSGHRIAVPAP
jgi:hypothetical protein